MSHSIERRQPTTPAGRLPPTPLTAGSGMKFGGKAKKDRIEDHLLRLRDVSKALMHQLNIGAASPDVVVQGHNCNNHALRVSKFQLAQQMSSLVCLSLCLLNSLSLSLSRSLSLSLSHARTIQEHPRRRRQSQDARGCKRKRESIAGMCTNLRSCPAKNR